MSERFSESVVEEAALAWLEAGGWQISHGLEAAHDQPLAKQADHYSEAFLVECLHDVLACLSPELPETWK